jgi:hypothetical protein
MSTGTLTRVAITVGAALVLGATTYGHHFLLYPPGVLGDLWEVSLPIAYGLAIVGAFIVNRWWALLPAVVPAAIDFYLYNLTDYTPPWNEEAIVDPSEPIAYGLYVLMGIVLMAAPLALGLLARWVWDRASRAYRSRATA